MRFSFIRSWSIKYPMTYKLLHSSDTQACDPIEATITMLEYSAAVSAQRLRTKGRLGTLFPNNVFDTINKPTRSHTVKQTPVDDCLFRTSNAND